MPADLFGYFDSFGRGLQTDEAIEFDYSKPSEPIRYTPEIRRKLRGAASSLRTYTEEVSLTMRVPAIDQELMTFSAALADNERITGTFEAIHRDALMTAFDSYEQGGSVLIDGVAGYSRSGKLKSIESIDNVTALHVLDVPARLDQLAELKALYDSDHHQNSLLEPILGVPEPLLYASFYGALLFYGTPTGQRTGLQFNDFDVARETHGVRPPVTLLSDADSAAVERTFTGAAILEIDHESSVWVELESRPEAAYVLVVTPAE